MNHPLHTRLFGGMNHHPGVLDRLFVARRSLREAHPIRVVEHFRPRQVAHQLFWISKIERSGLDPCITTGMVRQSSNSFAHGEQARGDVTTGETERSSYDVESSASCFHDRLLG